MCIGKCAKHGIFAKSLRIYKTSDNTFAATEWLYTVDKYNKKYFEEQIIKMREQDKRKSNLRTKPKEDKHAE
ncbi:MAG: hypothetical protein J6036_04055 [Clostridia bacterium]|nr:hypothetical protein [Clostridia bacterium]